MSGKRVLVLDDDIELVDVLKALLLDEDHEVTTANTAEQAMAALAIANFDVIVSDINLDTKNGLRFLADVRATTQNPHDMPRVVVMSGLPIEDTSRTQIMLTLGVDLVLRKPFSPDTLLTYIREQVEVRSQPTAYDSNWTRPFHEAVLQTLALNTGTEPEPSRAFIKDQAIAVGDFTGVISFANSEFSGAVALSFPKKTVEQIARVMFKDADMDVTDVLAADLAGELCNQACGMMQTFYMANGHRFEVSTPTLIAGRGHVIVHRTATPCAVFPFRWQGMDFWGEYVLSSAATPESRDAQKTLENNGDVLFLRKK